MHPSYMIPGFVSSYVDNDKYKHLYFFPGIDDNDNHIYNNIDLSNYTGKYTYVTNIDNSIDYKFYDKNIIRITCKLQGKNNFKIVNLKYK